MRGQSIMSEKMIRQSIEVNTAPETVWKVLTAPQFIPQYMYGCNAETDWKPGSPLLWRGVADGKLYVKGRVLSFEPPRRLVYTVFDPNSHYTDVPSNYLTMTCDLKPLSPRATHLEFIQGDFSKVQEGEKRYQHSNNGDLSILNKIKSLAESLPTNS
jgi:uncharacterized protein YndB with AHSA1/START domain